MKASPPETVPVGTMKGAGLGRMELRQLRYFLVVAEEENFHRAAERLHTDQSALSRRIHDLEEDLGFPLFERMPRGVRLSDAGRTFADDIRKIFSDLCRARAHGERVTRGQIGKLVVGLSEICTHYRLITDSLQHFRQTHPDIDLQLTVLSSEQQLVEFAAGHLDAGFFVGPQEAGVDLEFLDLLTDRLGIALPRAHRLADLECVSLAQLAEEPFIRLQPASSRLLKGLHACDFAPRVVLEVNSLDAVIGLVSAELGVAFVSEATVQRRSGEIVFKPIMDFSLPLPVSLTWQLRSRSAVLANFVEAVTATRGSLLAAPIRLSSAAST